MMQETPAPNPHSLDTSTSRNRFLLSITLVLVFILGLGIRLIDLDDPPLDFNPTRQLRSAIIARGLYYKNDPNADPQMRDGALSHLSAMERLEPPIFESLVAWFYRLAGGENLGIARVLAAIFWLIGAIFLFDLGRRMTSPWAAGRR